MPKLELSILAMLGLGSCAHQGDIYDPSQKPTAKSGECSYNAPGDEPKYTSIDNDDLGQCIRVRANSNKIARALLPGKEYLFASECEVDIDVAPHLHPEPNRPDSACVKDDPFDNNDRMKIYQSGKHDLKLVYTFAKTVPPRTVVADLTRVKIDVGEPEKATIALKATIPAAPPGEAYDLYVYLKHSPSGAAQVNRFYRVEAFALSESAKCLAEAPGAASRPIGQCPVLVEQEDAVPEPRQTGSGQGGDPPKNP